MNHSIRGPHAFPQRTCPLPPLSLKGPRYSHSSVQTELVSGSLGCSDEVELYVHGAWAAVERQGAYALGVRKSSYHSVPPDPTPGESFFKIFTGLFSDFAKP